MLINDFSISQQVLVTMQSSIFCMDFVLSRSGEVRLEAKLQEKKW
jgi:hypothetical protein